MSISIFDLFSIGIGPSSSHTVGPMKAANLFIKHLAKSGYIKNITRIEIELFGSLGATGKGHGTDKAVLMGLEGETPRDIDVLSIPSRLAKIKASGLLYLPHVKALSFDVKKDLIFHKKKSLAFHPNGIRFKAMGVNDKPIIKKTWYSVGGGFVIEDKQADQQLDTDTTALLYPFNSAAELLCHCSEQGLSVSQIVLENEKAWHSEDEIRERLISIWQVMQECVERGCHTEGILPGGLKVKRRAPRLYLQLINETEADNAPLGTMDWVNLFALAVNEENASGGRIVTAPTNGAAGIIPAVLHYYQKFSPTYNEDNIIRFLLTAGAIGMLYKMNASISGAEVGCQGEIGSACSMAAGALTEILGGTPEQVENAAEIAMEHNLGLTCDPIGGLVQVPCIERNAMGAVKAINSARLALRGDGSHFVSLDKVIKTMRETGADMKTKYKETARGGLAVNIIEC